MASGLQALQTVRDAAQYDELLFTRFDVLYKRRVTQWNLRRGRFNAPFRQPDGGLCDVFYVFGPSHFAPLVEEIRVEAIMDLMTFRKQPGENIDTLLTRFKSLRHRAQQAAMRASIC